MIWQKKPMLDWAIWVYILYLFGRWGRRHNPKAIVAVTLLGCDQSHGKLDHFFLRLGFSSMVTFDAFFVFSKFQIKSTISLSLYFNTFWFFFFYKYTSFRFILLLEPYPPYFDCSQTMPIFMISADISKFYVQILFFN